MNGKNEILSKFLEKRHLEDGGQNLLEGILEGKSSKRGQMPSKKGNLRALIQLFIYL
jgi:hypothetical protein